jgi:hypothetical protein
LRGRPALKLDEAPDEGVLPDAQPRAASAPGLHRLRVGPGGRGNPLEELEHQQAHRIEGEVAGNKIVFKGIYKLDGDELTVCLIGANGGRPAEFTSSDLGNGQKGGMILLKFKREKQDKVKQEKK